MSEPTGIVRQILLSKTKGGVVYSVEEVDAVVGCGLVGDRNYKANGKMSNNNVTLIEAEKIEDFCTASGLDFTAEDSRRNIVTRGVSLNPLLGCEFTVGPVRLKALELCEPCSLLAKRTDRAVLWGFAHKGGLRCKIVVGGKIRIGDKLTEGD